MTYATQAFNGYLLETEINQLQSLLNKAKNYNIGELLDRYDRRISYKITRGYHCLLNQLPPL